MTQLKEIIAYFLKHYPRQKKLSNARLTKMIYLADWHQVINYRRQISDIAWFFDDYGPFVPDVKKTVEDNPELFSVKETENWYGGKKNIFQMRDRSYNPEIGEEQKKSLDHVISNTQDLNWDEFIKLVYSTYPIMSSERYAELDLMQKADECASLD